MGNYFQYKEEFAKLIQMSANNMDQELFVTLNLVVVFQKKKPIIHFAGAPVLCCNISAIKFPSPNLTFIGGVLLLRRYSNYACLT